VSIFSVAVPWEEQTPGALAPMPDGGYLNLSDGDWSPDGSKLAGLQHTGDLIALYSFHDRKYQVFPVAARR